MRSKTGVFIHYSRDFARCPTAPLGARRTVTISRVKFQWLPFFRTFIFFDEDFQLRVPSHGHSDGASAQDSGRDQKREALHTSTAQLPASRASTAPLSSRAGRRDRAPLWTARSEATLHKKSALFRRALQSKKHLAPEGAFTCQSLQLLQVEHTS